MAKKKSTKRSGGRKRGVNKSEEIRAYKAAHPDQGPKAVAEALQEKGINVSAATVSNVLTQDKKKMGVVRRPGRPPKTAARPAPRASNNELRRVKDAAQLIGACGSADAAIQAIRDAEEIRKQIG